MDERRDGESCSARLLDFSTSRLRLTPQGEIKRPRDQTKDKSAETIESTGSVEVVEEGEAAFVVSQSLPMLLRQTAVYSHGTQVSPLKKRWYNRERRRKKGRGREKKERTGAER